MDTSEELLTTKEVSDLTGWSTGSIKRWALRGDLPYVKKANGKTGLYLFSRDVIAARVRQRGPREAIVPASNGSAA
jgi:predicted site-specific integrase-resolvase